MILIIAFALVFNSMNYNVGSSWPLSLSYTKLSLSVFVHTMMVMCFRLYINLKTFLIRE